jgi:hypothetical protein
MMPAVKRTVQPDKQSGHIISEWVVVTLLISIALFTPIPGTDQSVVAMMMTAIRDFHASNSYLLSLP